MTLATAFSRLFGIQHPIGLAPMGGWAGGALAAAVSNGGGLGLVGGGRGEREWVERELAIVVESTDRPWGIGFQSWSTPVDVLFSALEFGPNAVMLSFGDPTALAGPVRDAGVTLVVQVTDVAEAEQAVALGASGALVGTRFLVTPEALVPAEAAKAIMESTGENTERNRVLDIARGAPWPERYPARTLRNSFLDEWRGREEELSHNDSVMHDYRERQAKDDMSVVPIWASEAIDLIHDLVPASDLVGVLAGEAEEALLIAAGAVVDAQAR